MDLKQEPDKKILSIDIGGTKIAIAAITMAGKILSRHIVPTMQKGPERGIEQIVDLIDLMIQKSKLALNKIIGIGIGIPAVLERDTDFIIWGPNLKGWRNVDLRGQLEKHFNLPVCLEYDGHAAVMGEWWMGAAKQYRHIVNIIIGTGVGGGMVLDGTLIQGINRLAGAAGWFILDRQNGFDSFGEKSLGNLESRIAGPGISRSAKQLLDSQQEIKTILTTEKLSAKDIFEAAKLGDPLAQRITSEEAELLGMGIANIVSLVNPEIIVLGGNIGSNSAFLLPKIRSIVTQYAQPISGRSVKIVTSKLGVDAGLLGAAYGLILRQINLQNKKGGLNISVKS